MIIKIKLLNPQSKPEIKGDWIDLKSASNCIVSGPIIKNHSVKFIKHLIPLGVCIELPKGFEALVVPRSSTFKHYGIIQNNSIGVIDEKYCGDNDEWKFPALFIEDGNINEGDRICQFRIQPSQFASWYTKLKWLFNKKIELVYVDKLSNKNRGGLGSTGK